MTDKEKLIKIKKLADAMYYAAFNLTTDASLLKKAMNEYHQFVIHKYCKEEPVSDIESYQNRWGKSNGYLAKPVSEDLEEASKEWLRPQLDKSYANYGEAKMMELTHFDGYAMLDAIEFGAKWQKSNLWKPADGDDLPIIDREVIVLLNNGRVAFGHRPPEYWDGKDIITGKVTRNYVERYDKGLWNIPNVKYWLDVELPKEIKL